MSDTDIFVATESFATEIDGEPASIRAGVTRVRAGHPLLDTNPDYFKPVDDDVTFDLERTTAAPGESRQGQHSAPTVDEFDGKTRDDLNELATKAGVTEPEKLGNKDDVVKAIRAARDGS